MNKALFRAALAKKEYTQGKLAKEMNMAESTMIRKMNNDSFTISEAEKVGKILGITNLGKIFFAD